MENVSGFTNIANLRGAPPKELESVQNGVVAIGNFDGVHLGHQAVLSLAASLAHQENDGPPAFVMTFEPHPRTVFNPSNPVFRLTPQCEKARLMESLGLQAMCIMPFDKNFSTMSADDFVEKLLLEKLKVRHVVVGYDFHFGKGRQGSPEFLMEKGKAHGFGVTIVPAQKKQDGSLVFSSSAVRGALAQGDVIKANEILGYRYFVKGEIIHGEKRGRGLGFPTANMVLAADNALRYGIYAVQMRSDGKIYSGVASFGRRPMFDNGAPLLETYLFDFSDTLYGKRVEIVFVDFLRGEEKFDTLEALIEQINKDCENAKQALMTVQKTPIDTALTGNFA